MGNDFHARLKIIIESYLNLSVKAFERKFELGDNTIAKALKKKTSIKSDLLGKLFLDNPELDANWLFKGTGKMALGERSSVMSIAAEPEVEYVTRKEFDRLKEDLKKLKKP